MLNPHYFNAEPTDVHEYGVCLHTDGRRIVLATTEDRDRANRAAKRLEQARNDAAKILAGMKLR